MSYELSVVSHPTVDMSKPSLIIEDRSTGDRTIIGNIPAGLQRKCNEMSLKTSRLTSIFFSGILDWESVSGLPGLILTVSDQGVKNLGLYHSGNKVLQYMISCWRYFIFRFGMNLKACDIENSIEKSNIKYTPILINSLKDYGSNEDKMTDNLKLNYMMNNIFPIQKDPSKPLYNTKKITNVTLPKSIVNPKISTNWIITPNSVRGKFMIEAAKNLNCEIKHYKQLCNFQAVTLKDGSIVKPEQVLEPTRHFNPILVLDIPNNDYLSNTFAHDWINDSPNKLPYSAVFHFIDDSIPEPLSNIDYINFINSFGSDTTHFISHSSYSPNSLNFKKTLRVSLKWKSLLNRFFPLPKWSIESNLKIPEINSNVLPLISGQKLVMKSTTGITIDETTMKGSETSQFTAENGKSIYDSEIILAELDDIVSKKEFEYFIDENDNIPTLRKYVDSKKKLKDQVETLILGTGSALPSNIRNVLCNLIRIPFKTKSGKTGFRSIVLDAGENSFGTLRRLYQSTEVEMLLDELSIVYLSHLHADHHLGIVDFIREWNKRQINQYGENRTKQLFVITPWQYEKFINELNKIDPFINTDFLCHLSCDEFMVGYIAPSIEQIDIDTISLDDLSVLKNNEVLYKKNEKLSGYIYETLGIKKIVTCSAFHCEYAYSCAFEFRLNEKDETDTFKISYSGDTRPKPTFAFIGQESDLLIHESTLEDEKYTDAIDKKHCTTSEAVQVGILMKAKKIILTHFSQRYKSFTCSELVYKRLNDPICKNDLIERGIFRPSPPSSPSHSKSAKSYSSDSSSISSPDITDIPLEATSLIFSKELSSDVKKNAQNIEILFAFDNMKVEFDEFSLQRDVFEKQGHKLEKLFSNDQDIEDEFDEEKEEKNELMNSGKQLKKMKKSKAQGNNKKRKLD